MGPGDKKDLLPHPLINEICAALTYFFRTPEYVSTITQSSVEYALEVIVKALLDARLVGNGKSDEGDSTVRAMNKVSFNLYLLY